MANITEEEYNFLRKISDYEVIMPEYEKPVGWRWLEVGIYPGAINKLVIKGLVRVSYKSRSSTNYLLTDEGKMLAETCVPEGATITGGTIERVLDLSGLFSDITGYEEIKELLKESLQLDKPIHVLLSGPPSLAKTMFLWDIEQAYGDLAMPLLGSATSHAGLWDMVAERKPKVILVDELDKMSLVDMSALLSILQSGRIIRAKVGRKLDENVDCVVVAAANKIGKLPAELLSRFAKRQLTEYSASEYKYVVTTVLTTHEGTSQEDAYEIAMKLVGRTHDVRDAIRVARLAKRVGVKRAAELLLG